MEIKQTGIEGLVEIQPAIFKDSRGYFFESFQSSRFKEKTGWDVDFVQDNMSFSEPGVLRGLHLQHAPAAQGKLVTVIKGKAMDVVVDLRAGSATYGEHYKCILDGAKHNMMYVPEGFAHGFLALEACIFMYKCTNYYNKASEAGIVWNDKNLGIDWGIAQPMVSEKDEELPTLNEFEASLNQ